MRVSAQNGKPKQYNLHWITHTDSSQYRRPKISHGSIGKHRLRRGVPSGIVVSAQFISFYPRAHNRLAHRPRRMATVTQAHQVFARVVRRVPIHMVNLIRRARAIETPRELRQLPCPYFRPGPPVPALGRRRPVLISRPHCGFIVNRTIPGHSGILGAGRNTTWAIRGGGAYGNS